MPATDLPSPPVLRRADQRLVCVPVEVLGDPSTLVAVLFNAPVTMDAPYVIVPASERPEIYVADIGHAILLPDGRVHLDNTLQPPPVSDACRTLLVVTGPAAYAAMGVSAVLALREGVVHPSVCVLPEGATEREIRTLIAINVLSLYKRLHSA